jgi:GLPGLI family protein
MKRTLITIITILLAGSSLFAQQKAPFIISGTIEYQKRVNTYQVLPYQLHKDADPRMKANWQQALEQFKKTLPQFATFNSSLSFANNKMLLTPIKPPTPYQSFQLNPLTAESNTIYSDLTAGTIVMDKDAMGEQFLVKDNLRQAKWRITDETRDILGYTCRRANGLVSDSIYVVAFYTDKIRVRGGPELFSGLPGMILQLNIPHENVSWTATKITEGAPAKPITPPTKGKATDTKTLLSTIQKGMAAYKAQGINVDYYIKILGLM